MKIVLFDYAFVRDKPGISGLSDVVWEMARGLTDLGEEVHIVGTYLPGTTGPEGVSLHRFDLPPINYRNVIGHILIILKGWRYIRRELSDADIIHTPEYLSTAFFSLGRTPTVLTTPGNIFERIQSGHNPFDFSMTFALVLAARISAWRCAAINAISEDMGKWWEHSGANPKKITVFAYGVDTELFCPEVSQPGDLQWEAGETHILFVGRLSGEKGVALLLEALDRLREERSNLHLHLVGDGPDKADLIARMDQLELRDRVTFHGWVKKDELPAYYSNSFICVVPSFTEPLGRIVLEAMACGKTVIGANVGGIPDLVKRQETGLLFEKGDVDSLVQQLRWALDNPAHVKEMGQAALQFVQTQQSWQAVARRIRDEVYTPILQGKE